MPATKGSTWNESVTFKAPWTLRDVRRMTTNGLYNETPTYRSAIPRAAGYRLMLPTRVAATFL